MSNISAYHRDIIEYYADSQWLYKYVWAWGGSRGLHFGFAEPETKTHTEALINQYRFVIEKGKINKTSKVLDAGCGIGGAVVYIALHTGARVVGISLVSRQIEEARAYAKKKRVAEKTEFMVGDYTKTGLDDNSFDVVYGMESVCYANPQSNFLREAYRLLKPGGTLVLTDGYRKRAVLEVEKGLMHKFLQGWKLETLAANKSLLQSLKEVGFVEIIEEEVTEKTQMSVHRMRKLVWLWNKVGERVLGWHKTPIIRAARDNAQAMEAWINGIERGLFGYFTHVARKPR